MNSKYLISIIFTLCGAVSAHAQSLKDLFLKMPQEVCPTLSEYNKLELVDNQKNNKVMQTRNLMLTVSEMKVLEDGYLHLVLNKNAEKVMKLLTCSDGSTIIAVISTVFFDDTPDSSIELYDTEWRQLDGSAYIDDPISKNFRYLTIKPNDNTLTILTADPITPNYNGKVENPKVTTITKVLTWNGERFVNKV